MAKPFAWEVRKVTLKQLSLNLELLAKVILILDQTELDRTKCSNVRHRYQRPILIMNPAGNLSTSFLGTNTACKLENKLSWRTTNHQWVWTSYLLSRALLQTLLLKSVEWSSITRTYCKVYRYLRPQQKMPNWALWFEKLMLKFLTKRPNPNHSKSLID